CARDSYGSGTDFW
nr:immunoglobulin heavy chain junction region [Macaca mulatta]MOV53812.1 immunoglobulin heavy chain junction region [Macaca mulatta]MOV54101.1 immunoglobulin heavy chain junction region [Macaca mulatta]MOV54971.1 immunoglobulin heavy chain junction region [Macaca mulatta]MOV55061.1 immunoglobulin heavy chain junction region [Macaca mulatta]